MSRGSCASPAPAGRELVGRPRGLRAPPPIFVTYSVVRGDAKSYVLQIVHAADGGGHPPLGHTSPRWTARLARPQERHPRQEGVIPTRRAVSGRSARRGVQGGPEEVTVPAGRFNRRQGAPPERHRVGVRSGAGARRRQGAFPDGQLELLKRGTAGAQACSAPCRCRLSSQSRGPPVSRWRLSPFQNPDAVTVRFLHWELCRVRRRVRSARRQPGRSRRAGQPGRPPS